MLLRQKCCPSTAGTAGQDMSSNIQQAPSGMHRPAQARFCVLRSVQDVSHTAELHCIDLSMSATSYTAELRCSEQLLFGCFPPQVKGQK